MVEIGNLKMEWTQEGSGKWEEVPCARWERMVLIGFLNVRKCKDWQKNLEQISRKKLINCTKSQD